MYSGEDWFREQRIGCVLVLIVAVCVGVLVCWLGRCTAKQVLATNATDASGALQRAKEGK
jgi:hypothetical protein